MLVNMIGFTTEKELQKLTGLNHDELWENGFNLDDWDFGFQTDKYINKFALGWLDTQLDSYCCGCEHTEYNNKHYYIAYHS